MEEKDIKKIVKDKYGSIAKERKCCCGSDKTLQDISKSIGYSEDEISSVPDANLGLGCGNPTALGQIKNGDIVLDLGSGAGFDAFLAAKKVGESGKVIGVDMTKEMIVKARKNALKYHYKNVEFKLGEIENLPIKDATIDIIISNCVINLSPDKLQVFREAYRVLKSTGKMYVSDIVLLKELTPAQRKDEDLIAGCVGGALLKEDYLNLITKAGFSYKILEEDKGISKRQYQGIALESLKVEIYKK